MLIQPVRDVCNRQAWNAIKPLLPESSVGRPRTLSRRQILNAIVYVLKTGGQ